MQVPQSGLATPASDERLTQSARLVNKAGVAPESSVETATEAVYDEVFSLNAKVPFFVR